MSVRILYADDEPRMRKLVHDFFEKENFEVIEAENGEQAVDIFYENKDISLVILDVMMPKMNGWEACKEIRKISKVPIVILTAKSGEEDELNGFEIGADEYITKPFLPKILVARAKRLLKGTSAYEGENMKLVSGGIVLDKMAHIVTIDGNEIELSYKEFELLEYFLENEGIALSRERILDSVWDFDYFGDARTIDTHVKKLRSKMGSKADYIKTVWGIGYKYNAGE